MAPFAQGADLVAHEATNSQKSVYSDFTYLMCSGTDFPKKICQATNSWIAGLDDKSPAAVEKDTIAHGHSTPEMAGEFALACNAKRFFSLPPVECVHYDCGVYMECRGEFARACKVYVLTFCTHTRPSADDFLVFFSRGTARARAHTHTHTHTHTRHACPQAKAGAHAFQ